MINIWSPELVPDDPTLMRLGMDVVRNEPVTLPINSCLLVAGGSGSGKSFTLRPLMATAVLRGALTILDGAGEEAAAWSSVTRVAVSEEEILSVIDDLYSEMLDRKRSMANRGITLWDGLPHVMVVDEGVHLLGILKGTDRRDRLQRLLRVAAQGKSRGMHLWWATSNPVTTGHNPGLNPFLNALFDHRFALRMQTEQQVRCVLGEDTKVSMLDVGRVARGRGFLADYPPNQIQVDPVDDIAVRGLKNLT